MATATDLEAPIAAEPIEAAPPEGLYEVVDGQIVEKSPMGAYEVEIASILCQHMGPYAVENRLGRVVVEMLFQLKPGRKLRRRPDVAFLSAERWPLNRRAPKAEAWDVIPDLVVEVISPSDNANEVVERLEQYFEVGVRRAWVVYPSVAKVYDYESTTRVQILSAVEDLDGGAVLPGFRLPLTTLFEADEKPADEPAPETPQ
ncbi:hypothetical protein BH23PLA1_BH23PLA1_16640 [soil metagenome]